MIKNKTFTGLIICLVIVAGGVNAITIGEALLGIPEVAKDALLESGEIFLLDRQSEGFKLLPNIPMSQELVKRTNELKPDVLTEGLYIIPYSGNINGIDIEIYNIARKVSFLSEVKYLSARKKSVIPLFEDVYAISNLKKKKPIEVLPVDSIPASDSLLLHMKEANLGRGYYQIDYIWDGQTLGFFMKNLSNLRSTLKIVGKEQMQNTLLILPTDEGFLIHGSSAIKLSNSKLVFKMMDPYTSFYRRVYAIVTWIYNTIHNTDRVPDFDEPLEMDVQ